MNEHDADNQPAENQPEHRMADASGQSSGVIVQASWRGPLPPPDILRRYDEVLPGTAGRILDMAESRHRYQLQYAKTAQEQEGFALETTRKVAAGDVMQGYLGVIFAFIIAMTGLAGGIYLSATGRWEPGLAIRLSSLAGLVGVFVYGTQARRAERRRNAVRRVPEEE